MKNNEAQQQQNLLCPSYVAKPGASLFGIIQPNGKVNYLPEPIEVDKKFLDKANEGRNPEQRFRFTGNCAKTGCAQWDKNEHGCGLVSKVIKALEHPIEEAVEYCPIKSRCRWFAQQGKLACANCNEIMRTLETKLIENLVIT